MHLIFVWLACAALLALIWFVLPVVVIVGLIPVGFGLAGVDAVRRRRQMRRWQAAIPADSVFWNGALARWRPAPAPRDASVDELLEEDK